VGEQRNIPHDPGQQADHVGAYGLQLENVGAARELLVDASPEWPRFRIGHRLGTSTATQEWMTEKAALLKLQSGGEIALDRERGEAIFTVPRPVDADELVHPLLAPVAAVTAYWYGRESFHAGAFVVEGRAWALLGERGVGKSTLVARLALDGVPIAADDMLILEEDVVHVAPRSVDLRREAAEVLGVGEGLGVVGARERWRLRVPPIVGEVRLAGWVFLAWGERTETVAVRGSDRLMRLAANRGTTVPPRDAEALLELASLPAYELRRPRSWESLTSSVDCLLDAVR
jgi:hypothetical protein